MTSCAVAYRGGKLQECFEAIYAELPIVQIYNNLTGLHNLRPAFAKALVPPPYSLCLPQRLLPVTIVPMCVHNESHTWCRMYSSSV